MRQALVADGDCPEARLSFAHTSVSSLNKKVYTMKKILFAVVCSMALAGCGGDRCSAESKCSADLKSTEMDIAKCRADEKEVTKCKAESNAVFDCAVSNQVCGTDNKTDVTQTGSKVAANCKTQAEALLACQQKP
jgi:uncharacterized lipoprotein YehR (DUF1307 family)